MTVTTLQGDCRGILPALPADHFDTIVTSPPYWGLRSYLPEGHVSKGCEIGLEPTLDGYVEAMAAVGRELWRVLKPEGTFWLNLGDSYANVGGRSPQGETGQRAGRSFTSDIANRKGVPSGLKPKDLCMVPARVALRLQADGWFLRSEIIWAKPNPMPESVTDRPTSAHEKVYLFAKGERYFYDADAIREDFADERKGNPGAYKRTTSAAKGQVNDRADLGFLNNGDGWTRGAELGGRNARNVWTIASQPYSGAHFATMPPALVERCLLAGCPKGGTVLDPFFGAGTTGLVADRLGRNCVGIELNTSYVGLAQSRIKDDAPLFAEVV